MRGLIERHPVVAFFALTFAITRGIEALLGLVDPSGLSAGLALQVAGAGPSLAGFFVAWAAGGRRGTKDLLSRAFRWRVGPRWYLLVLVVFPALLVGVIAVATVLSGQPFRPTVVPWLWPAFLLLAMFLGPLQEEFGWRAFALPRLTERYGWVGAGLALGVVWALWHRTPGTLFEPLGPGGLGGLFLGAVVPDVALSVLMAWVFVRTRGSALLAGFGMHAAANFALFVPAMPAGPGATATMWSLTAAFAGCLATLALAAVVADGGRRAPTGGLDPLSPGGSSGARPAPRPQGRRP